MNDTQIKILNLATTLTQERGFGGFSYLDLAEAIGIKAASIHYYYKSKDDLALALVEYTHELHTAGFEDIERQHKKPEKRLEEVIKFFQQYVAENKFCLCGMLVAELHSVSKPVSKSLDAYFNSFQTWLARQFDAMDYENPERLAMSFLSTLEGSLLLARVRNNPKIVREALSTYFDS